jgi:3-isopropylmalate dehydrogenase
MPLRWWGVKTYRLGVIAGDGIGPEVVDAALAVLDTAERTFGFRTERERFPWSGAHWLATRQLMTEADLAHLRTLDALLFGALGHPDVPRGLLERNVILGLRFGLDLYVNLRPVRLYAERLTPLKGKRPADIDMLVIRENTEDVYAQAGGVVHQGTPNEVSIGEMVFTRAGCERVIRYAFERARERRHKLTLVDKSNAIAAQEIWRRVFDDVGAAFPDVERDAVYVDAASMWFVTHPERFDVVVTTNLFGDILTDLGAAIAGGLGVAASGNIHPGRVSMFEPVHGSAPKYAGKGVASPVGAIGALALLLRHVGEVPAGDAVEDALARLLADGTIPGVEAGASGTMEVAHRVAEAVGERRQEAARR